MKPFFVSRGVWFTLFILFWGSACAPAPPGTGSEVPNWPYPSIDALASGPLDVIGFPDGLNGRWLVMDPLRNQVLVESRDPRYVAAYAPGGQNTGWYDLGYGVRLEALVPSTSDDWLFVARQYGGREEEGPVTSRAILEIDLGSPLLVGSIPLAVDLECHGLEYDERRNRLFLLDATEEGLGTLTQVDLYRGIGVKRVPVGIVPLGVERHGLAFSPRHLEVGVVVGGDADVSDFAPRDAPDKAQQPRLVIYSSETLERLESIQLPRKFEPKSVVYSPERGELVVLVSRRHKSLVLTVNLDFHSVEQIIDVQGRASDLAVLGHSALVATERGLFRVDLGTSALEVVSLYQTGQSGELVVSPDGKTAWLRVFEVRGMEQPGLIEINLVSRSVIEVLP